MIKKSLLSFALVSTLASCGGKPATGEGEPEAAPASPAAVLTAPIEPTVPIEKQIVQQARPLMTNPWAGWETGVQIVRRFVPHGQGKGIADSLQPDLVYTIVEKDQKMERVQEVEGKPVTQSFSIETVPERASGIPSPGPLGDDAQNFGIPIGGSIVASQLRSSTTTAHHFEEGREPQVSSSREWTLKADEKILLRRDHEQGEEIADVGGWWAITNIGVPKAIGEASFLCVETQRRRSVGDGFVKIRRLLSAQVPGHLVEEVKEYYETRESTVPQHITVEKTVVIRD